MVHHIGYQQRALLQAIHNGAELWKQHNRWTLNGKTVNRERAATLYFRGFVMGGRVEDGAGKEWRQEFTLTDKGKAAL